MIKTLAEASPPKHRLASSCVRPCLAYPFMCIVYVHFDANRRAPRIVKKDTDAGILFAATYIVLCTNNSYINHALLRLHVLFINLRVESY